MSRFWVSWEEEPTDDYRPFKDPPVGVVAWWCTGFVIYPEAERPTICAVVDAEGPSAAKRVVATNWSPATWRFCEARPDDWLPPADRFPSTGTARAVLDKLRGGGS